MEEGSELREDRRKEGVASGGVRSIYLPGWKYTVACRGRNRAQEPRRQEKG